MYNGDDTNKIISAVSGATMMMDPFFKIGAASTMAIIQYFARMVKEKKLEKGNFENFQKFLKATDGKYFIMNLPEKFSDGGIDGELIFLQERGVRYNVMPDLNQTDGFVQIAVYENDREIFLNWYENFISKNMQGGQKSPEDLKYFTEGNMSMVSVPVEGKEEIIKNDFDIIGINYTILPDLKVGDGNVHLMVANADMQKLEHWYSLYKSDHMNVNVQNIPSEKMQEIQPEVPPAPEEAPSVLSEMRVVNLKSYAATGEMTEEEYMETSSAELRLANEKYEGKEKGELEKVVAKEDAKIRSQSDVLYEKYKNDDNYVQITINHETLVNNSTFGKAEEVLAKGFFPSRIPGTWGKNERTLVIPKNQVFIADDGKTYTAFIDKYKKQMIFDTDGNLEKTDKRLTGQELYEKYYEPVSRGFARKENMVENTKNIPQNTKKQHAVKDIGEMLVK